MNVVAFGNDLISYLHARSKSWLVNTAAFYTERNEYYTSIILSKSTREVKEMPSGLILSEGEIPIYTF